MRDYMGLRVDAPVDFRPRAVDQVVERELREARIANLAPVTGHVGVAEQVAVVAPVAEQVSVVEQAA